MFLEILCVRYQQSLGRYRNCLLRNYFVKAEKSIWERKFRKASLNYSH